MTYRVWIDGHLWATGLTEEAAEVMVRENRELRPDLWVRSEVEES